MWEVENRMVVDSEWDEQEYRIPSKRRLKRMADYYAECEREGEKEEEEKEEEGGEEEEEEIMINVSEKEYMYLLHCKNFVDSLNKSIDVLQGSIRNETLEKMMKAYLVRR